MIFDKLDRKIRDMKELRRLENIKANKAQQEATDIKYRLLLTQVHQFTQLLNYAHDNMGFLLSDTISTDLANLFLQLEDALKTGFANKDLVADADTAFKAIQTAVKKDWFKHYAVISSATVSTLKVISGIDAEKVTACLNDIKVAETWSTNKAILPNLKKALSEAGNLIQSLSLDQEIITFLETMNSGKASIADLNENVLIWIKKEALEHKIKLSFSGK